MLLVSRELDRAVETGRVVARVVEATARGAIRHRARGNEVAPRQLDRVDPEPPGGDRHRALEAEVELRAAEAAVEARRDRVRQDHAVPGRDVPDAVGAGQRPVHPVERRRLGSADVRADVLEGVVAQRDELALGREARLQTGDTPGGDGTRSEVLHPVLGPADGDPERTRRETDEDDVRQDRRLDAERPARVGRRQEPEPVGPEAEGRRSNPVQGEGPLEVGPRGEASPGLVPVADDAVALDRQAGEARHAEALAHHQVGARERLVHIAVVEAAVVDRLRGRGLDDGLERLVLHGDELGGILGEVAILRDHQRERLADVAGRADGGRVVRHR